MHRRDLLKTLYVLGAGRAVSRLATRRAREASAPFEDLPAYIARVMARFEVPGAAVAIVLDGQTVFCQGFGVRDRDTRAPVDQRTLFCLASNTKPFTATCLAMLESDGLLRAGRLVREYLPSFRLSSPDATSRMTVGDLLCHLSGLPPHAGDLLFFPPTTYTLAEVVERIHALPLVAPFGSTFAYENVLYAVAALLIQEVSGQSYGDFVVERIFEPLDMTASRVNADGVDPNGNVAVGYRRLDGALRAVPPLVWKNNPGAGGIYSSAFDMLSWMRLHLQGGVCRTASGAVRRLYTRAAQEVMWTPRVRIGTDPSAGEAERVQHEAMAYGAGWFLSTYRGARLVWHTGEFPGFASKMTLVPTRGAGILVLTNQEQDEVFDAITNHALDLLLGKREMDWPALLAASQQDDERQQEAKLARVMASRTLPPEGPVDGTRYEGRYIDAWYGSVSLTYQGGQLRMQFDRTPSLTGRLEPWSDATFLVRWDDRLLDGDALIRFHANPRGVAEHATMQRLSPFEAPAFDFNDLRLVRAT